MTPNDLIEVSEFIDEFNGEERTKAKLKLDSIRAVTIKPHLDFTDIQFTQTLLEILHAELRKVAQGQSTIFEDSSDLRDTLICLEVLCKRNSFIFPNLGFRDLISLDSRWRQLGWVPSYRFSDEKIVWIDDLLEPLEDEVHRRVVNSFDHQLVNPISPRGKTGWEQVDTEIEEMRRSFVRALSPQACAAIGNACVRINEAAADAAYIPRRHTPDLDPPLPRGKDKNRAEAVIETELGTEQKDLIQYARSTIALAHHVKHNPPANRTEAGIAADASIALANMLRRLVDYVTEP